MHSVTTEHGSNPEFPGNPATTKQTSQVTTQIHYLKNAVTHLRNAYNGQDVIWSDQGESTVQKILLFVVLRKSMLQQISL